MTDKRRPYSSVIIDGLTQTPSRAMLRAVGFDDDDFKKPQIGIASTWSMVTPCNMHINQLADHARKVQTRLAPRLLYLTPSPSVTVSVWVRPECATH